MASESKDYQFSWFVNLSETQGLEAANKYAEILNQMTLHLETIMPKPSMAMNKPSISNVEQMFENLANGPTTSLNNSLCKNEHLPNDLSSFSLSSRNGSDHSSIACINDLINVCQNDLGLKNVLHNQQQQQTQPTSPPPAMQPSNMQMALIATANDVAELNLYENLSNHNGGQKPNLIPPDMHGNAQHYQGLPSMQAFVNPANPLSGNPHITQK